MVSIEQIKEEVKNSVGYYKMRIKNSLEGSAPDNYRYFSTSEFDLDLRVDGMDVEFSNLFDNSVTDYKYNGLTNTLIINKKYLKREDINLDNLYMDIALNIAYYDPMFKGSGFGSETYEALNKGFREILANTLTSKSRSKEYFESDEYVYANLMTRIFDLSTFWRAYQENEPDYLIDELKTRSIEFGEKFSKINEAANRNYIVRNSKKESSNLDEIEYKLFDLLLLEEPSRRQLDDFMTNMVFSSKIFKDEKKYQKLDRLNIDIEYQNYLESSIKTQNTL